MQNKTLLAIVAAAAIILLGAGGVFLYSKNRTSPTPNNTVATVSPSPKEASGEGSWKDIFTNGGNKMCTFDTKGETGETKGTIYNSGEKAYGEIQIITGSKTQMSYVIRNGETFYMWGDSFPTGIKMTLSLDELSSKLSGNQPTSTVTQPAQQMSFKCSDWVVDSSKFTPPANIKFTDMTSLKTGVTGGPTGAAGNSSQCSICTSLTGAAKTACLTQFSCK